MSNPAVSGRSTHTLDDLFTALESARRREILRLVDEQSPDGVPKDDLAVRLAAVIDDKRPDAVTDDERQRALVECSHRDLPVLADAGLLEERDDGTVVATDHWLFDGSKLDDILTGRPPDELDAVFEALADSRRRTILAVLGNRYEPLSTETLARAVAAREAGTTRREVSRERVDQVRCSLVHVHLPLLTDAGLVGYDADADRISFEGHPVLRVSWLEDDSTSDASSDDRSSDGAFTTGAESNDVVRALEDRELVVTIRQSPGERTAAELVPVSVNPLERNDEFVR